MTASPRASLFGATESTETQPFGGQSAVSVEEADSALRHLVRCHEQLKAIGKWAADAAARITPRAKEHRELLLYFMEKLRDSTNEKKFQLPSGHLSSIANSKLLDRDDDAFLEALGGAIKDDRFWKQTVTPVWSEVMKLVDFDDDGNCFVLEGGEVLDADVCRKKPAAAPISITVTTEVGKIETGK